MAAATSPGGCGSRNNIIIQSAHTNDAAYNALHQNIIFDNPTVIDPCNEHTPQA